MRGCPGNLLDTLSTFLGLFADEYVVEAERNIVAIEELEVAVYMVHGLAVLSLCHLHPYHSRFKTQWLAACVGHEVALLAISCHRPCFAKCVVASREIVVVEG